MSLPLRSNIVSSRVGSGYLARAFAHKALRQVQDKITHHPRGLSQDTILSNRSEMALEFVSGADFLCKLMCRAGPVDLRGSRGPRGRPDPPKSTISVRVFGPLGWCIILSCTWGPLKRPRAYHHRARGPGEAQNPGRKSSILGGLGGPGAPGTPLDRPGAPRTSICIKKSAPEINSKAIS